MPLGNPNQPFLIQPFHIPLQLEHLESRRLMSVNQAGESVPNDADFFPIDPTAADFGFGEAAEFWEAVVRDGVLQAAEENDPFGDAAPAAGTHPNAPLPAIPFDESVDPFTECPGLDPNFCLPGDANQDGQVDFSDFLLLNENFGSSGATRAQGDFDGDGSVTFADFLILSHHFGSFV